MPNPTFRIGNTNTQIYRDDADNNKTVFTNNGNDVVKISGVGGQDTIDVTGNINITTDYEISGTSVINTTTLGSGVVNSSLTSVGNLTSLTIDGDLTVNGTTTILNTETLTIEDPLMKLGKSNAGDTIDTGFYSLYNDGVSKYSGLFRDATDNTFKFFVGTTVEPTTTIDTNSDNGYLKGDILVGSIDATSAVMSGDFTVDTNTLHVDSSNNRVGLGTISPTVPLDVVGDINTSTDYNISGTQVLSSTTLGTGIVNSSLTSNTGNLVNTGTMNITTGNDYQINSVSVLNATTLGSVVVNSSLTSVGSLTDLTIVGDLTVDTDTLYVDSSNNRVGINNATPATDLDVVGNALVSGNIGIGINPTNYLHLSVSDSSNNSQMTIHNESDVASAGLGLNAGLLNFNIQLRGSDQKAILENVNGDFGFYAKDTGDHRFYTTDSNTERFSILNNGNVGINDSSPSYNLDVGGDINFTGVLYQNGVTVDSTIWASSGNDVYNTNTGNVGIGTDTPTALLHIKTTLALPCIQLESASNNFINCNITDTGGGYISFANTQSASTTSARFGLDASENIEINVLDAKEIRFRTTNIERMSIEAAGNVVINNDLYVDAVIPNTPGQFLHMEFRNEDTDTLATTTITGSNQTILSYFYTPKSASSFLSIEFDIEWTINSAGGDTFHIDLLVVGIVESTRSWVSVGNSGGGGRGSLFPISTRYSNSTTGAFAILVRGSRTSGTDVLTMIDDSGWTLKITEIAR